MKRSLVFVTLMALVATIFCGCSCSRDDDALIYNPYVEAFTHGTVSRTTPAYLVFNEDISLDKLEGRRFEKALKISPKIEGEFGHEGTRTIVFKPKGEYQRGTKYTVTVDVAHFIEEYDSKDKFQFSFSTLPMHLRASFEGLTINSEDSESYDLSFALYTPDKESGEDVERLVSFSENVKTEWEHPADGKQHFVKLLGVKAGEKGVRQLSLKVGRNNMGLSTGELISAYVPGKDEFLVYEVNHVTEPEKYIEVTFTKNIDSKQELRGLAFIEGNRSESVTVKDNSLRLYPDVGVKGVVSVRLDSQIRSESGVVLGKSEVRKVDISPAVPQMRFVGEGVVVPQSDQVLIPFQAVYLRGVVVRVIKIPQQNIGQFLQINSLDENSEMIRVGRLVTRKTIFLDEQHQDLSQWNTYAIDLSELITPEPGAIYRVELSFGREHSAYPCADQGEQPTKEELLAKDEIGMKTESGRFDEGGYYYYYDDYGYSWYDYNYRERDNPCSDSFYIYNSETRLGRNVLSTNIGLMAKRGDDDKLIVLAHDLLSTMPLNNVEVEVYNYQHQLVGSSKTSSDGRANVEMKGRPYYLVAKQGKERSYLKLEDNLSLSMSDFDVSGVEIQKGLKGFIYGERGVWRPGDDMHLSFMLQDSKKTLPADHPVVMELYTPLGQLYQRQTQTQGTMGLYCFRMDTHPDAQTGAWQVKVHVGGATFTKRVRVETIKPNRLKIDLAFKDKVLTRGKTISADLHSEWLQGATARNLKYEMDVSLYKVPTKFEKFERYNFDDPIKDFGSEGIEFAKGTTDSKGDATIGGVINFGDYAPGMLMASFDTRVYEESGNFSIDVMRMPFSPYNRYIGIRSPQTSLEQLHTGKEHKFDLVSVDKLGNPQANVNLDVKVYKISWYWWWSANRERIANYISNYHQALQKSEELTTDSNGRAELKLTMSDNEWGTYLIVATDKESGHSTGVLSYFDWASMFGRREADGGDAAVKLTFTTDKEEYAPGEEVVITLPSSQGSRAVVSVENGATVLNISEHECKAEETTIKVKVTEQMMPNAYLHITLLQPHGATINDLPIRMYGVVPIGVSSKESHLEPLVQTPEEIKPESQYKLTVSEKSGRPMAYSLAVVDEGLLDLTRFETPNPWDIFYAHEALGVKSWDMYKYVVGAYGGRIEQLFSIGGDASLETGPKATTNRFKPVVQFIGPFKLEKGKRASHTLTMPNYNGRVRVMVVAGDGEAYGAVDKSVKVRKPVMLLGTLPRVIGTDEEMAIPATVFATEQGVGDVAVSIECSDNMEVMGSAKQTLNFREIGDKQAMFRVKVGAGAGTGKVKITAVSKSDRSVYETEMEIRSVRRPQTEILSRTVAAGESLKESIEMIGAEGTNKLWLELSNVKPINLASRLDFLLGYPHTCIEQITSKAFPQLYVGQFASLTEAQTKQIDEVVKFVLGRYRAYQIPGGGMSYWAGHTTANAWGSAYSAHFMVEAEAKGYYVNSGVKNNLLNYLSLMARSWSKERETNYWMSEETTQAYRLYVLALAKRAEVGAMNRLKESKQLTAATRSLLAAAYAEAGRADVAKGVLESTQPISQYSYGEYDYTFGSNTRDEALRLLAHVLTDNSTQAAQYSNKVSQELASDSWLSTQTTGFALVALSKYIEKYKVSESMKFSYSCDKKSGKENTTNNIWSAQLLEAYGKSAQLEVTNSGESTLFVRVITEGTPREGEEKAYQNGLTLSVEYQDSKGERVDVTNLEQGTNFTAVVTVANPTATGYNNIELTHIFPAGWEILNTRFTDEERGEQLGAGVSYQDIRDDRVYSYIDRLPANRRVTVRVNLAAVYAGKFYAPPVYTQAMYDHLVRANSNGAYVEVSGD